MKKTKLDVHKLSLLTVVRIVGIFVIIAVGLMTIAMDVGQSYYSFLLQSERMRAGLEMEHKKVVRQEVTQAIDLISERLQDAEKETKENVFSRSGDAYAIAEHLYRKNKGEKSDAEIQTLIVEALRPLRFFQNTGYYFIIRLDGVSILSADRSQREGENLLKVQDAEGRHVIREMIAVAVASRKGGSFYSYRWTKPGEEGNNFRKIAFVKRFAPYNWLIGTGLYVDEVEKQIRANLLFRISKIRFGREGYLFVNRYNGDALVSNGRMCVGQEKLWDVFPENREGMKKVFAQELLAARKPSGDFISYSLSQPNARVGSSKTSFIRGIPELQWLVGGGFYASELEEPIRVITADLKAELWKRSGRNAAVIVLAILFFLFLFKIFDKKINGSLNHFSLFFARAASSDEEIDLSRIQFEEFAQIADNVNRLLADKKAAQNILFEEKEKLSVTLHSIGDAVISTDRSGNVDIMNSVAEKLTGWDAGEAKGKRLADIFFIVNAKTGEKAESPVDRVLEQGKIVGLANHTKLLSREGAEYQIADSAAPIRDKDGNIKGVALVFRDVTEQYRKDEQLRRSEESFRAIFEAAKTVAFIIAGLDGKKGKILEFSPGAEAIFGYARQEAIGMPVAALHLPEDVDKFPAVTAEMAKNKIGFNGESTLVRKSGGKFPALFSTYPLFSEDGAVREAIGVVIDISRQKEAEEELRNLEKLRSLGTFAGGLAHDFNNIMMGLFGNISLAKMKLAGDNPVRPFIEKAEQSLERATGLTNQLLTFAKGGAPVKSEVSLPGLVEETVQFDLSGSSVKAVFAIAPDLWRANVDRGQMQQVFSNLTINSRQAMPEGGLLTIAMENREIPTTGAAGLPAGRYLKITVADQGTGIDKQHLSKIFDPYFTTKPEGRGLGLATTYSIIAKHGGLIDVESEGGLGTTFTLYLPALETAETASVSAEEKLENKVEAARRLRALLMDDEAVVRQVVGDMLEVCGFDVETAADGNEAIEMYRQAMELGARFDGVIMDITIPGGIGGKEAVRKLLEIDPDAKAIVSSGYAEDPIMACYGEYGFRGVIAKPFKISELKKELARVFGF